MPCDWGAAGYSSFEDCVAANQDKDDPEAYCAAIKLAVGGEALHPDFVKIRDQFIAHLKDSKKGIVRYAQWVRELGLDATKPYGATAPKEAFAWVDKHVEFNLWKEDKDARYWKVEAAFPLESMNLNVYTTEELQSAARSLIGKAENINHEYDLPMGRDRRDTVDAVGAEFEDDIVEAVLRVGREAKCHKGFLINDLIEQRKIIHVSLEAQCQYGTGAKGECAGMYFSGLALLTKETLPGIPLTRMMPLESIMREAFKAKTTEKKGREIVAKTTIKEAETPPLTQPYDQTTCPQGQHFVDGKGCVPDATIVPTTPQTTSGTTPAPQEPAKAISGESAIAIDDKVGRLQAERKVKDLTRRVEDLLGDIELKEVEWAKLNRDLEIKLSESEGRRKTLEDVNEKTKKEVQDAKLANAQELHDLRLEAAKIEILRKDLQDSTAELEKLNNDMTTLNEKYNKQLGVDLDLTKRLTKANEELVRLTKEKDTLDEQLKFAKRLGKRIVKIQTS